MNIIEENRGEIKTFILKGRLDSTASPAFQEQLLRSITQGTTHLIIDLSEVNYISSAGVRSLVLIQKEMNKHKGKLYLVDVSKTIEDVLRMTGFLSLFTIVKKNDPLYTLDKGVGRE